MTAGRSTFPAASPNPWRQVASIAADLRSEHQDKAARAQGYWALRQVEPSGLPQGRARQEKLQLLSAQYSAAAQAAYHHQLGATLAAEMKRPYRGNLQGLADQSTDLPRVGAILEHFVAAAWLMATTAQAQKYFPALIGENSVEAQKRLDIGCQALRDHLRGQPCDSINYPTPDAMLRTVKSEVPALSGHVRRWVKDALEQTLYG